jgi:hypothetical protein
MENDLAISTDLTLTGLCIARPAQNFAADIVAPIFNVAEPTAKILALDATVDLARQKETSRSPGSPANRVSLNATRPVTYLCADHSLEQVVPDEHMKLYGTGQKAQFLSQRNVALRLLERLRLDKEIALVTALAASQTGALTSSPGTKWDNASGTPLADIRGIKTTIMLRSGVMANAIALPQSVMDGIKKSTEYKTEVHQTMSPSDLKALGDAGVLGALCGFDPANVTLIANVKNTATEGQTASLSEVWGENVIVYFKEDPQPETANFALSPAWSVGQGDTSGGGGIDNGILVETYRDARCKSWVVSTHWYYDQEIVNANAGHLFTNTLT